jgi:hypothetical protein
MNKFSIMNLDANKKNVKKEEVQETSCGKHRNLSFGVLKGVRTQSVFMYMCVAAEAMTKAVSIGGAVCNAKSFAIYYGTY